MLAVKVAFDGASPLRLGTTVELRMPRRQAVTDPARTPRQGTAEAVRFHGGLSVVLPFFARRAAVSLFPRPGAAPRVPFDPAALLADPSVTWIGHATLLVRMEGTTFLTDPMFSKRASPLPFAGPPRLVEPGVPLAQLPRVDFAVLSHDHYDHTDARSIRALAARGTRFIVPTGMGALAARLGRGSRRARLVGADHGGTAARPLRPRPALLRPHAHRPQPPAVVRLGRGGRDAPLLLRRRHRLLSRASRRSASAWARPISRWSPSEPISRRP